jgi:hypothetical protein
MANPRGNLAGATDPSQEGWQARALAAVREHQRGLSSTVRSRREGQVQVFVDLEFLGALRLVAHQRGMSIVSYARRAIAKQIAKDLGVDWTVLLAYCTRPVPYGSRTGGPPPRDADGKPMRSHDDGTGYGDWTN